MSLLFHSSFLLGRAATAAAVAAARLAPSRHMVTSMVVGGASKLTRTTTTTTTTTTRRSLATLSIPPPSPMASLLQSSSSLSWLLSPFRRRVSIQQQEAANTLLQDFIWFIKRTFQPSLMRKKRKTGFLVRLRTKDGRKIIERRKKKGRMRLGGAI